MEQVKDIILEGGAYAGVAAVIGIAVLAMLYFSQARDVRRLREWAGRAPERDAEVQQLAAQIAAQAVADAYAALPVIEESYETAEQDVYVAVEAPAAEVSEGAEVPDVPVVAAVAEGDAAQEAHLVAEVDDAPAAVESDQPAQIAASADTQAPDVPVTTGQPLTAAGATAVGAATAAGGAASPVSPPSVQRPRVVRIRTGSAGQPAGAPLPPLSSVETAQYQSSAAAEISGAARQRVGSEEARDGDPRKFAAVAAAVVVAGAVGYFGYTTIIAGGDSTRSSSGVSAGGSRPANSGRVPGTNVNINRSAVTVSVLNGTRSDGLAALVGDQVEAAGFSLGAVANAPDAREQIDTVIYYTSGNKPEAQEVALELDKKRVEQINEATRLAGGSAQVVVVVGSDAET